MIPQTTNIRGTNVVPMMNEQILDNVDIVEILERNPKRYMIINEKLIDLSRRHEYETDKLGWVKDDSIIPVVVYMEKVKNKDTGQIMLHLILQKGDKELGRARLCSKQGGEMMDMMLKFFERHQPPTISNELDFSTETTILMILLQSDTYSFTKITLIDLGIPEMTVNSALRRLIDKKIIFVSGNKGRRNIYSGTMTREEMKKFFSREDE